MATFPTLLSGHASVRYPLTESTRRGVQVLEFTDFSEQRWRTGPTLKAFTLSFTDLRWDDVVTLRAFFDARKGSFEPFELTIAGDTHQYVVFVNDTFEASENDGAWAVELPVRQIRS
jgi:hypothetical protein